MAASMEAYMKAVDQQMGSDASTSCSLASRPLGSDSSLASKRTALTRTPLSVKSKPFVSRLGLSSQAQPFVSNNVQWVPTMVVYQPAPQEYSEEAQEDIYLAVQGECETLAPTPYSETLQEDVYLGNVKASIPHPRGRLPGREARCFSRTPSPATASVILSEVAEAAANCSQAAEDNKSNKSSPPVKRTFIHYDVSEVSEYGDAQSEACSQDLKRSSSAPCILLKDTFQTNPIESMAELHLRGECSPCAYFYHKQDGCRWGAGCSFCHECPASEIKKRKKIKFKAMRERKMMLELELAAKETMSGAVRQEKKWCDLDFDC